MNGPKKTDFLVAHPHKHHVYHLAKGIASSGASLQLVVPLYNKGVLKTLARLPIAAARKLRGYEYTNLHPRAVTTSLHWALKKLWSTRHSESGFEQYFDECVAQKIKNNYWQADVFVSLQDYMPKSVAAAKLKGWRIWSDQILNNSGKVNLNIRQLMLAQGVHHNPKSEVLNIQIIGCATVITVPSDFVASSIVEVTGNSDNINIIPYGVETEKFKASAVPDVTTNNPIRILARANSIRKGGSLLIEAIERHGAEMLAAAGRPIHFDILGTFEPALRECLSQVSLPIGIDITDKNYPHSEVPKLIAASHFFIMPSLAEGMSLIATEVMAIGRPVVLTEQCGIKGFDTGGAGILANATAEGVAAAILEMLRNQFCWKSMGEKANRMAREHYSWATYEANICHAAVNLTRD
jgi:glycosyltransferase involved in cell wall biosynthesis